MSVPAITSNQITQMSSEQIALLKNTILKGNATPTDNELKLFLHQCQRTGLDPFTRQIYSIERWNNQFKKFERTVQVSIDGFRVIAERSGQYAGQDGPWWCGEDGVWKDVWLLQKPPSAAKVTVFKKGQEKGFTGVATYSEYVQLKKDGQPISMWANMPANQLAKCAESLALRKAFPNDLSGLYTVDEYPEEKTDAPRKIQAVEPRGREAHSHPEALPATKPMEETLETGFAPVPPIVAETQEPKATPMVERVGVHDDRLIADYEIRFGSLAGNRLKDKAPEFWLSYAQELTDKLIKKEIPEKFEGAAQEIIDKIEQYLLGLK